MRTFLIRTISMLVLLLAGAAAEAQRINIEVPPAVAAAASESVDVTLDGSMLRLASKFLSETDAEERATRDMIRKLEGIYVRSYEFDREGAYDRGLVDRMRAQLGPSWKRIVTVSSRTKENVEIYTDVRGDAIAGLLILSAEPKELTIVNIVGPIDLDKLASLEGQFGIPHVTNGSKGHGKEHNHD